MRRDSLFCFQSFWCLVKSALRAPVGFRQGFCCWLLWTLGPLELWRTSIVVKGVAQIVNIAEMLTSAWTTRWVGIRTHRTSLCSQILSSKWLSENASWMLSSCLPPLINLTHHGWLGAGLRPIWWNSCCGTLTTTVSCTMLSSWQTSVQPKSSCAPSLHSLLPVSSKQHLNLQCLPDTHVNSRTFVSDESLELD